MSSSDQTQPDRPSDDSVPEPGEPPTQPKSEDQPNAQAAPATNEQDSVPAFDLDEEFAKLAAELDDIPGFRNLQPLPQADATGSASGPRDWEPGPEDPRDGEFVPPDPEIRLDGDPARVLGWALVVIGTITVMVAIFLHSVVPSATLPAGLGIGLLGALLLLWRLPKDRDDEWDNGARI